MVPGIVFFSVFGSLAGLAWSLAFGHGVMAMVVAYQVFGLLSALAFVSVAEFRRVLAQRL